MLSIPDMVYSRQVLRHRFLQGFYTRFLHRFFTPGFYRFYRSVLDMSFAYVFLQPLPQFHFVLQNSYTAFHVPAATKYSAWADAFSITARSYPINSSNLIAFLVVALPDFSL